MHPRRAIRDAIKARILGGETMAGDRVFATMTPPIALETVLEEEGPVIMAYIRRDRIADDDRPATGNGGERRTLELEIEGIVVGADTDSKCDDLAEEIEALLEDWLIPGFPAAEMRLTDSEIAVTDAQDRISGGVFMTYEIKYWKPFRAAPSDDFVAGGPSFLAIDVFAAAQGNDPEILIDGPENNA